MAKVFGWYDNECGHSKRLVETRTLLVGQSPSPVEAGTVDQADHRAAGPGPQRLQRAPLEDGHVTDDLRVRRDIAARRS